MNRIKISFSVALLAVSISAFGQNPYKIPVVVHVIHQDGVENISDEQIKNGIQILSRNWRKQNPDTTEIVSTFKSIAADMEVEFELAKLDPQGNCTNGIYRIRSPYTNTGGHEVKTLAHWPQHKYLNIYIVRNAAGLAGHALMPFQADSMPHWDGIVMGHNYWGNMGTSNEQRSMVLSHELGHYMNLYHIWGGNNVPDFYYLPVGQAANCAVGDSVPDTPDTHGWSTCNLNATSCDGNLDNVQNFMDYSYCGRMFTVGQKQRVHAALNSSVAGRNNLWSAQNLTETGYGTDGPLCVADFNAVRRVYCVNQTVEIKDASYHDPVSWTWTVGSGSPLTGSTASFSYPQQGKYDISLEVSDGSDMLSVTKQDYIKVLETAGAPLPYIEGFESWSDLSSSNLHVTCEQSCIEIDQAAAASGSKSIRVKNTEAPVGNQLYTITSPRLDLSTRPNPVLRFRYAFARRDSQNTDKLVVRMSRDCGATWIERKTIGVDELSSVAGIVSGTFVPVAGNWSEVLVVNTPSIYKTDNIIFRFEYTSGGGNDFYLDDINVFDISELSVTDADIKEWRLAPNPTAENFRVEGPFEKQDITILAMDGKMMLEIKAMPPGSPVSVSGLPSGVYQVKLTSGNLQVLRKLVVSR